jgi:hypothetical protein
MDLSDLISDLLSIDNAKLSEADTRAQIIDPILESLGWTRGTIRREPYAGWVDAKGYVDYLLHVEERPMYVVEAKKSGRTFDIPDTLRKQGATSYKKLWNSAGPDLKEALDQCIRYATHTGALYACATNGSDWLFFKPTHPHRSLPAARVVIFNGLEDIPRRPDEFELLLGRDNVEQGTCQKALLGREVRIPTFAQKLRDAFPYNRFQGLEDEEYSLLLDQMLRHYVVELTSDSDFDAAYVAVKGNRNTSRSLEAVIAHQVGALRPGSNSSSSKGALEFGSEIVSQPGLPNVLAGRTIILHGSVGVGKTSFLRSCENNLKRDGKLKSAVWTRVDLLPFRDRPFEIQDVNTLLGLLCTQIQENVSECTQEMSGHYDPDAWAHLRDIYNQEVRRLQKGKFPQSDDSDQSFVTAAQEYVWSLRQRDPQEHLVRVLKWLTTNCRLPVVLVLDNSDQLGVEFQEFLYKLAERLQKTTCAVTILVLRTEALLSHGIREHAIASVGERFYIEKAPLTAVLSRRFELMQQEIALLSQKATPEQHVAHERISVLMDTIGYEAQHGSDTFRIIDAAGNGSMRDNLRATAAIFRSSQKLMDRLVRDQAIHGRARLRAERTLRALIKDDLASFEPNKLIPNVFLGDPQVVIPYSLGIRMLQQVRSRSGTLEYRASDLLNDFATAGVDRTIAGRVLVRLRAERFLLVPHMLRDVRDSDALTLSRLGHALLDIILAQHDYLDAMSFETIIYERDVYNNLKNTWNSGAEYYQRFDAMGKLFGTAVLEDDKVFRQSIDLSLLEPVVAAELPGLPALVRSPSASD